METVPVHLVCDKKDDCLDGSDEADCVEYSYYTIMAFYRKPAPLLVNMNENGQFTEETFDASSKCPETHFRCPGQHVYCMPVYLRCNGVKDCPGGEDEVSCDDVTCPGYYRCRSSSVCLHGDHLCDGWPQCPERDDELLCNASCPSACHCQGLAFVCQQPFAASHYPDLRYLDATGSGMVPEDVAHNFFLVYLSLAVCKIKSWPVIELVNLQILDLSYNHLSTFYMQRLHLLVHLRVLRLMGNPLQSIVTSSANVQHTSLTTFDASHTLLTSLESRYFQSFPELHELNVSYSSVNTIGIVSNFEKLTMIDVRGCIINTFPLDVFQGLSSIQILYVNNFMLCCKTALPDDFNRANCFHVQDDLSSCEDLLHSPYHRLFLWIIAILSIVGNASHFVSRLTLHRAKVFDLGYNLFFTQLCLVKCLIGVYLVIVCAMDEYYRGTFMKYEKEWKTSVTCTSLGFLYQLSIEVSVFIICLISLDQFMILKYPFSTVRFKGRSAVSASALAWTVGLLLAAVPLLPSLSHWSFYGQTGICVAFPVVRHALTGMEYFLCITMVLNFVFDIATCAFEGSIYKSVCLKSASSYDKGELPCDVKAARRFVSIVLCDVSCRFPTICTIFLSVISDINIPGEINAAINVFLLPLSSALIPLLLTYNIVRERQRQSRQDKLQRKLEATMRKPTNLSQKQCNSYTQQNGKSYSIT